MSLVLGYVCMKVHLYINMRSVSIWWFVATRCKLYCVVCCYTMQALFCSLLRHHTSSIMCFVPYTIQTLFCGLFLHHTSFILGLESNNIYIHYKTILPEIYDICQQLTGRSRIPMEMDVERTSSYWQGDVLCKVFLFISVYWYLRQFSYHMVLVSFYSNTSSVTCGPGTANHFGAHKFTSGFSGVHVV